MTLRASACTLTRSIGLAIPIGLLAAALISRLRVGICTMNQRELALSGFVALCIGLAWYGLNSPGSGSSLYVSDLEKVRESTHQIADLWPLVEPQALEGRTPAAAAVVAIPGVLIEDDLLVPAPEAVFPVAADGDDTGRQGITNCKSC